MDSTLNNILNKLKNIKNDITSKIQNQNEIINLKISELDERIMKIEKNNIYRLSKCQEIKEKNLNKNKALYESENSLEEEKESSGKKLKITKKKRKL